MTVEEAINLWDNGMMELNEITVYGGSSALVKVLASTGMKELYPPQISALKAGLLKKRDSFVVAAPTASGKTLIAEMAALDAFLDKGGKTIYLVPLRALAREKYEDFSRKYREIGMRVIQSTGEYDSTEPWLHEGDLVIATNEKVDSLIRHRAQRLKNINLVVADEIHLLRDPQRGPTLEVILTRLRSMNPDLRLLALSATIPNAKEISDWLDAKLVQSNWRPVPLREGVYFNGAAIFNDGTVRWVPEESDVAVLDLALETIKEGGQALIFVNTRKATEAVAKRSGKYVSTYLSAEEKRLLDELSRKVLGASPEPTRVCKRLAESVSEGVAFHHAGIIASQRKLVEDGFKENKIKCIASTTTLAMGLNLPSRRVVIRDWRRYESGRGMQPIPTIEIKQMAGRAGRPLFDEYGEAVLVARDKKDESFLFENYIQGELERINSQLGNEYALRSHILASIAGLFTRNRAELTDFLGRTFFAFQKGMGHLSSLSDEILKFLEEEGMVAFEKKDLTATRFGRRVSELYIDPLTGVIIRDSLQLPKEKDALALPHMITRTPDMMVLSLRKRDLDEMLDLFYGREDTLLIPQEEKYPTDEMLSQLKTASALMQWIVETPEDDIVGHFGIGPGDLRSATELSDWLLYAASEIAKLFKIPEMVKALSRLRIRVQYGVKEELLELVSLRGVGRVRARNLYNAGFRTLREIRGATLDELSKVPTLGKAIAENIKRQVAEQDDEILLPRRKRSRRK